MKKFNLHTLVNDKGFVLLSEWQEGNLRGGAGTAAPDNCDCESLANNCKCNGDNCGCPPTTPTNNCTCGSSNGNPSNPDNCNCYSTATSAATEAPTALENSFGAVSWLGMI